MADPSGRFPLGVLTRPAPDWFDDEVAYGGYFFPFSSPAGNNYVLISLYNNASGGQVFKIYGITVASDGNFGSSAWATYGVPATTLVGPCQCIRSDRAMPPGLIYQDLTHSALPIPQPYAVPATAALIGTGGFDSMTYFPNGPMFVIPSGYALNVVNNAPASAVGASFWYQVTTET